MTDKNVKKILKSPLFLSLCILMTVYTAASLISIIPESVFGNPLHFFYSQDIIGINVESNPLIIIITLAVNMLFAFPPILLTVGLWTVYIKSIRNIRTNSGYRCIYTGAVAHIVLWMLIGVAGIVGLIFGLTVMTDGTLYNILKYGSIAVSSLCIPLSAFYIIFSVNIAEASTTVKRAETRKEKGTKAMLPLAILSFICAFFSTTVFGILIFMMKTDMPVLTAVYFLTLTAAYVLIGIISLKLKKLIRK